MKLITPIIFAVIFFIPIIPIFAYMDGCHGKHSCPSDTGSYQCGDNGYCSECTDNKYCKEGKSINAKFQVSSVKAFVKNPVTESPRCIGTTLCINGKVKSIVDGDTLYVDTYKVRLSLVNTPETGQKGYQESKGFTKYLCPQGSNVIVDQDDKQPFDQFRRVVGKVYCSGKLLNYELLSGNHATIMKKYCKTSEFSSEEWATKYGC